MKYSYLSIVIAILALTLTAIQKTSPSANPRREETAYERIMRTRTLRCGYALWPTFEDIDPNTKQLKGIGPEFANALAEKLNLKIEWTQEVQWGQEVEALQTGKIDAICSDDGEWNYTSTAVRDFAEPMAYFPIYLYGRKGETRFKTLQSINSPEVTLSAMEGDISMSIAVDQYPKAHRLEVSGSGDPSLVVLNVLSGKADLLIEDSLTVDRVNGPSGEKLERLYDKPYAVMNASFSVAKGQGDLLNMLNQGFKLLYDLGISDQILDKYDPSRKIFYRPAKRWG